MKLQLPETYDEITVRQYRLMWSAIDDHHDDTTTARRVVEILGGLDAGDLKNADYADLNTATAALRWIMDEPDPFTLQLPVQRRLYLEGIEYGFIPDWTKLTVAEYADLETFCHKGLFNYLEKAMAVMYRPIQKQGLDMYEIETYEPCDQREAVMGDCPMSVCVAAMVFFCAIQKELATTMQRCSKARPQTVMQRLTAYIRSGAGTA